MYQKKITNFGPLVKKHPLIKIKDVVKDGLKVLTFLRKYGLSGLNDIQIYIY